MPVKLGNQPTFYPASLVATPPIKPKMAVLAVRVGGPDLEAQMQRAWQQVRRLGPVELIEIHCGRDAFADYQRHLKTAAVDVAFNGGGTEARLYQIPDMQSDLMVFLVYRGKGRA